MNTYEEKEQEILFSTRLNDIDESLTDRQTESMFEDIFSLNAHMDQLFREKKWKERNKLVPLYRKLYSNHNFGFEVGEIVETNNWRKNWEPARILEHNSDTNNFLIANEKGWQCIVSGYLIRKSRKPRETMQSKSPCDQLEEILQLSLF